MALKYAVYINLPIPTAAKSPDPSSKDSGVWSPLSCTLVYTPTTALLVDCPATIAATNELASWIKSTLPVGCTLKYFIASHAHGDHFMGFPILKDVFPSVNAIGTRSVVEGIAEQYSPSIYEGLWLSCFPPAEDGTSMPETKANFESLPTSNDLYLDGHLVKLYDVPHGDTHANSFIHFPDLGLVVAGDLVYNGDCHQWLGEASTQEKRDGWMKALSQIMALKPRTVVSGHSFQPESEPTETGAMETLKSTEDYIKAFQEELRTAQSGEDLFNKMRARFSRWNLWILQGSCMAGFENRQTLA